jgi:hypothetical protein
MADEYDNTNSGALFANDRKTKASQPTHKGEINIVCPHCGAQSEWWMSAWVKEAKRTGKKFFSMAFTSKEEPKRMANPAAPKNELPDDFDDDIPF